MRSASEYDSGTMKAIAEPKLASIIQRMKLLLTRSVGPSGVGRFVVRGPADGPADDRAAQQPR